MSEGAPGFLEASSVQPVPALAIHSDKKSIRTVSLKLHLFRKNRAIFLGLCPSFWLLQSLCPLHKLKEIEDGWFAFFFVVFTRQDKRFLSLDQFLPKIEIILVHEIREMRGLT